LLFNTQYFRQHPKINPLPTILFCPQLFFE
jgi:hypothetical protein